MDEIMDDAGTTYLDGLVVNQFADFRLIWCEELGYVLAMFKSNSLYPRKCDWIRVWYNRNTVCPTDLRLPSSIARRAKSIEVEKFESLKSPCPTFIRSGSHWPYVTVFARRVAPKDDVLFIELLSLRVKIPDNRLSELKSRKVNKMIVTLHFADTDTMEPVVFDVTPFVERKSTIWKIRAEDNTCEISIGFDVLQVESHVVSFAKSTGTILRLGHSIGAIISDSTQRVKPMIFRLCNSGSLEIPSNLQRLVVVSNSQNEPHSSAYATEAKPLKSAASQFQPAKLNRRSVTFDDNTTVHEFTTDSEERPHNIKSFIEQDSRLRKPFANMSKNPVKSIMKKPAVDETTIDINSLSIAKKSIRSMEHTTHPLIADSIENTNGCGYNHNWLQLITHIPNSKDVSELSTPEKVFLFGRHAHNIGKPNEFHVWFGYTNHSFQGVIEFMPSLHFIPFRLKLGMSVKAVVQKVARSDVNFHGMLLKPGTSFTLINEMKADEFQIKHDGNQELVQVLVELTRHAESGQFMVSSQFGYVLVPQELLQKHQPYPSDAYYQVFNGWIEPIAEPTMMDNQYICWKAVKLIYSKAKSADDHLEDLIKSAGKSLEMFLPQNMSNAAIIFKRKKSTINQERRRLQALKDKVTYIPKEERLDKLAGFIYFLEGRELPEFVLKDVILPCRSLLSSSDKKRHKVRATTRTIAYAFVVSEDGKEYIKSLHYSDKLIKWLVTILHQNSTYVRFEEEGEQFQNAYRAFISYYDVPNSSSDSG